MDMHIAQPRGGGFDWYDFWQAVNMVATGFSVLALLTGGKEGKELGQVGTILGLGSTAAQFATTPPRCGYCQSRMSRPVTRRAYEADWVCWCGAALYPAD